LRSQTEKSHRKMEASFKEKTEAANGPNKTYNIATRGSFQDRILIGSTEDASKNNLIVYHEQNKAPFSHYTISTHAGKRLLFIPPKH